MRYLALLRGINVGGKSIVRMADLKECVEGLGHKDVSTFIASGNVLLTAAERDAGAVEAGLERAIERRFGEPISVFVLTKAELGQVVKAIPSGWADDKGLRVYVGFLRRTLDGRKVAAELTPREGIDELVAAKRAVIWATSRDALTRSGMQKVTASPIYKDMTIRNITTTLKLHELLAESSIPAPTRSARKFK